MNHEKNISACDVNVDFARLLWESDCRASQLHAMADQAKIELGPSTVADLAGSLFRKLAEVVDALKGKGPHVAVCKVRMAFDQPTNELTVHSFLTPLELFLNRVLKAQFPAFEGVRVTTRYERVETVRSSDLTPLLFGPGVRKPFEA